MVLIPDRKAARVGRDDVLFAIHNTGSRQVINDPVVVVLLANDRLEGGDVALREVHLAEHLAELVLLHEEVVGRVLDEVAAQEPARCSQSKKKPPAASSHGHESY